MASRKAEGLEAFHALVLGRVQGVGFRYSACRRALSLGLRGWVRNLDDGSVEVLAEGDPEALADYQDWLREGPEGAWVQDLRLVRRTPTGSFDTFSVEF